MNRTTNGFNKYADSKLLTKSNFILAEMTGNSHFTNPFPSLADLKTKTDAYSDALSAATTGDREHIAVKNTKKQELVNLLRALGNYVTAIADGNIDILMSSGFDVTRKPEPVPTLLPPEAPLVTGGAKSGSLVAKSRGQKGTLLYNFMVSEDYLAPAHLWTAQNNSKGKALFENLKSATRYFVKVCQYGKGEQCVESQPTSYVTQ